MWQELGALGIRWICEFCSFAEYNGWGLGGCFWFGELILTLRLARGAYLGMFGGNFWYRAKFQGM